MTLEAVTSHLSDSRSPLNEKEEFYASVREAYKKLKTWQRTARFLDVSPATVMRWGAGQHAPGSAIKRLGIISVINRLRRLPKKDLETLRSRLSNNDIFTSFD